MKALVYTGPKAMAYQDVPAPRSSADVSLVQIQSVGICGSDMHGYLGHDDRRPAPLILSFDHAALAEPLAVCWHSVRLGLEAVFGANDDVKALVIGGGAIGVGSALCLHANGVVDITVSEPNPVRAEALKSIGSFKVSDPNAAPLKDSHYDLVIDAVGFGGTRANASATVKPGGVIVHVGLGDSSEGFDVRRATLQEITFIGTYTYTNEDFTQTVDGLANGLFGSLDWYETRPLSEGAQAFADILAGKVSAPKIILRP